MKECEYLTENHDQKWCEEYEMFCDERTNCYYKQLAIANKTIEKAKEALKRIKYVNFADVIMNANAFMTSEDAQIDLIKRMAGQAIEELEGNEWD